MNKNLLLVIILVPVALAFWGYAMLNPTSYVEEELEVQETTTEPDASAPETSTKTEPEPVPKSVQPDDLGEYSVVEVIDGDTVMVSDGTEFISVRIIGIDAPETVHAPGGPECYNTEATLFADRTLAGQTVHLATDPTQDTFDQYNRLLAYVTLSDDRDFGELMIEDGYAREYTFKGRAYINQATYRAAEETAKAENTGLWSCE